MSPAITRIYPPRIDKMQCLFERDLSKRKALIDKRLDEIIDEIKSYSNDSNEIVCVWKRELWDEWEYLRLNKNKVFSEKISPQDIEQARSYPIDRIITFNNGVAEAWCHADKNPSLTLWKDKNVAYCFPCHKVFDPIQAVMERQGLSFTEAVKMLR